MIRPTLKGAVLTLICMLGYATGVTHAQVTYQGLIDGIYPARLVVEQTSPKATLSISSLGNRIHFIGGCNEGFCKYRGVDTSLALMFDQTSEHLSGRVQFGDGTSKSLYAEAIAFDMPFADGCNDTYWLRSWSDATAKHSLVLATLPGKQVKGSIYLSELGTSFSASGIFSETSVNLILTDATGKELGTLITQQGEGDQTSAGMLATLDLEGSKTELELGVNQEMSLTCLQAAGRFDMVYPIVDETPYASLPVEFWKEAVADRSNYGHVWFEPARFDKYLLSGWLHREGPEGQTSEPINLLRGKDTKLRLGGLMGGKRTKTQLLSVHKAQAIAQHPLHTDKDFQTWVEELDFEKFTLTTEGLAVASKRHPIYGQLQSIIPWRELPKGESFPKWLTQSK